MKRHTTRRPRGTVLIAALVCLAVVMGLLGHLLLATLRAGRQLRRERDLRQCQLLLQAGQERAALQLRKDKVYRGETWNIASTELADRGQGRVTIEVLAATADRPSEIRISAEYPFGDEQSIRRSQTIPHTTQSSPEE